MNVVRCHSSEHVGREAAAFCASQIKSIVEAATDAEGERSVRVVLATGASQLRFLEELVKVDNVPWDKCTCFHLDEYVGIDESHPASFAGYLRERFLERVNPKPKHFHFLNGKEDPALECARYSTLLDAAPIDIAFIGIGENGHLAFNDPPVCDFFDRSTVKVVELDEACRRQQLGEGWFPELAKVPTHALSMTMPAVLRCRRISCVVPDARKATAVRDALEGPICHACPASAMRMHPETTVWIDSGSAHLLRDPSLCHFPARFPGFVDLQVNGADGVDFSSPSLTLEDARRAFRCILRSGCAAFLPTVITSPPEVYANILPVLAEAADCPDFAGRVLGIHLEGPLISPAEGFRGCHSETVIRNATESTSVTAATFETLQGMAKGRLRLITVAAEVPGISEFIEAACSANVRVLLGHQRANGDQLTAAARAGASGFTHLGNGCATLAHRHDSPLIQALGTPEGELPWTTVIADGVHLPPHALRAILKNKGVDRTILVSDANPVVGMADFNNVRGHTFAGLRVSVDAKDGSVRDDASGGLAGSGANLMQCANTLVKLGLGSPADAVHMGFAAPLQFLGEDRLACSERWGDGVGYSEDGTFRVLP